MVSFEPEDPTWELGAWFEARRALLPNGYFPHWGAILPSLGLRLHMCPVRLLEGFINPWPLRSIVAGLIWSLTPPHPHTGPPSPTIPWPMWKGWGGGLFLSGQHHLHKGQAVLPPCLAASLVPNACPGGR